MAPEMILVKPEERTLARVSQDMLENAHKFFRMTEVLPSLNGQYNTIAQEMLRAPTLLEDLQTALAALDISEKAKDSKLTADIDQLTDFMSRISDRLEGCLPERYLDEVEYSLLYQSDKVLVQLGGVLSAASLMVAVLNLGALRKGDCKDASVLDRRTLLAETNVSLLKMAIQKLTITMPDVHCDSPTMNKTRQVEIKEWLDSMLNATIVIDEDDLVEKPEDNVKDNSQDSITIIARADSDIDMPTSAQVAAAPIRVFEPVSGKLSKPYPPPPSESNQVFTSVLRKQVDKKTLEWYGIPYSVSKSEPDRYILWQAMSLAEFDVLIAHSRTVRTRRDHERSQSSTVVDNLLQRWLDIDAITLNEDMSEEAEEKARALQEFEKDLEELKEPNKKTPRVLPMPPPPRFDPNPPIIIPHGGGKRRGTAWRSVTKHYQPWAADMCVLQTSLRRIGWKPIYTRGSESGQTWFNGEKVVHIRRFNDTYLPQSKPATTEDLEKGLKTYLTVGKDWIDEEAIQRAGFQYHSVGDSWSLDPRLSWFDVDKLAVASSAFREERLFHKYRHLSGGDLYGPFEFAAPAADYLQGARVDGAGSNVPKEAYVPVAAESEREAEAEAEEDEEEDNKVDANMSIDFIDGSGENIIISERRARSDSCGSFSEIDD